ncbi:MAG: hypothetical protein D8M57_16255 [Candidatus Scalindua sp. AMX11]|nr:MAG: hypothetical protein DWQ00_07025 [Candidatus Scalindua sp.]NOG82943.1 hypothetical protein [Planctomycetota bacterium]RZV68754.1 MAG: hypothetical protein EX341_16480 [Candidatus Scalindua sp. SCAELEC01]TDE63820.1 MAG: hypothetical protein D8M57_16255 [Candidatus Scalindua sp. AMX11]
MKIGHGGDIIIASALGLHVNTVTQGRKELLSRDSELDRIRKKGGGRPPLKKTPEIITEIERLMKNDVVGDPITGLK